MKKKKEKKLVKEGLGPCHGRSTTGTGHANSLENGWFLARSQARSCYHRHGPCQASGHARLNFLHFFASYLDKYLQNKLKQHKTNKIKAIKLVGCLPRSARLKSLA